MCDKNLPFEDHFQTIFLSWTNDERFQYKILVKIQIEFQKYNLNIKCEVVKSQKLSKIEMKRKNSEIKNEIDHPKKK